MQMELLYEIAISLVALVGRFHGSTLCHGISGQFKGSLGYCGSRSFQMNLNSSHVCFNSTTWPHNRCYQGKK